MLRSLYNTLFLNAKRFISDDEIISDDELLDILKNLYEVGAIIDADIEFKEFCDFMKKDINKCCEIK